MIITDLEYLAVVPQVEIKGGAAFVGFQFDTLAVGSNNSNSQGAYEALAITEITTNTNIAAHRGVFVTQAN